MSELRIFGVWKCAYCSLEKRATAHQLRKTYCSNSCMSLAYMSRMIGNNNPNFRNVGLKICDGCKCEYHSYFKKHIFCSRQCSDFAKKKETISLPKISKIKKVKAPFIPKSISTECIKCGTNFKKYPSQKKMFYSYQCHLDSGGAFRAGMAAAKAIMKYGAKKDANHNEIFDELRKHCAVYDISSTGMGVPDGLAWINDAWHLFDVKNPNTGYGKRGLNPVQKKWLTQWKGGPIFLIYTKDEAKKFANGEFETIKRVYASAEAS